MADLLALPGRSAASSLRLAKLLDSLRAAHPGTAVVALAARFRHYVELARPLAATERELLDRPVRGDGQRLLARPDPP